jgi:hypothetical protein
MSRVGPHPVRLDPSLFVFERMKVNPSTLTATRVWSVHDRLATESLTASSPCRTHLWHDRRVGTR